MVGCVVAELGHFALILASLVALMQIIIPAIGVFLMWPKWMHLVHAAALLQFFLTAIAFTALTQAFVQSDFSLALVANHSHSAKPLLYKLSGVWGNHEGSMLLWVLVLSLFSALIVWFGGALPIRLKTLTLSVQAAIASAFYAFILLTSNPFERLTIAPFEGMGLNPLLQDPGLAFHPPALYVGYVGLAVSFSFAVAALLLGEVNAAWARWVRPWTLVSWVFLTLGIALGSWWAYYELGWGGWWFWDPVENASFMPWLFATALLHSATVAEKRGCLKSWTLLLAILAFSFSLLGTFLVRSGILTSVHAFATDPGRGVFILAILIIFSGGALALYAWRGSMIVSDNVFAPLSRETALISNNILLVVAALVVFIGTFWPLVAEIIFGRMLSVGPPFFEIAVTPFLVALAILLPLGSTMPWKTASTAGLRHLWWVFLSAVLCGTVVLFLDNAHSTLGALGLALAVWLAAGVVADLAKRAGMGRGGIRAALWRIFNMPRSEWGKSLAHFGLAVTIAGISAITAWESEDIRLAETGDQYQISDRYALRFDHLGLVEGPNYQATRASMMILKDSHEVAQLFPEKRFYPVSGMVTTEAAIEMGFLRDIYVVIGDSQADGRVTVKAYIKPLANWIWLGAIIMSLGGLTSLLDRRYRLASVGRSRLRMTPSPALER